MAMSLLARGFLTWTSKLPSKLAEQPGGGGLDGEICSVTPWATAEPTTARRASAAVLIVTPRFGLGLV
jgi:hypothetical protein